MLTNTHNRNIFGALFDSLTESLKESLQSTRRMCMFVCVCVWRLACKHDKSRLPGPIKFKLGVCVPHNEYRNPIVFGADPRSFWVKTYKKCDFVKFWYFFGQIVLVNTISPDRLVRSSLNLVCVFPTMSTGTLLFVVQIQGLFGSKLRKNVILWNFAWKHDKCRLLGPTNFKLGVCVPHDEYRNPIVFRADPRSFWVKT